MIPSQIQIMPLSSSASMRETPTIFSTGERLVNGIIGNKIEDECIKFFKQGKDNKVTHALITLKVAQEVQKIIDRDPENKEIGLQAYESLIETHCWPAYIGRITSHTRTSSEKYFSLVVGEAINYLFSNEPSFFHVYTHIQQAENGDKRITILPMFPFLGGGSFTVQKQWENSLAASAYATHNVDDMPSFSAESGNGDNQPSKIENSQIVYTLLINAISRRDIREITIELKKLKSWPKEAVQTLMTGEYGDKLLTLAVQTADSFKTYVELLDLYFPVLGSDIYAILSKSANSCLSLALNGNDTVIHNVTQLVSRLPTTDQIKIIVPNIKWQLRFALEHNNIHKINSLLAILSPLSSNVVCALLTTPCSLSATGNTILMALMEEGKYESVQSFGLFMNILPVKEQYNVLRKINTNNLTARALAQDHGHELAVIEHDKFLLTLTPDQRFLLTQRMTIAPVISTEYRALQQSLIAAAKSGNAHQIRMLKDKLTCSAQQTAEILYAKDPVIRSTLLTSGSEIGLAYQQLVSDSGLPPSTIDALLMGKEPPPWCCSTNSLDSQTYTSRTAIDKITEVLRCQQNHHLTLVFFNPLLNLDLIGKKTLNAPIVSGDLDGSSTRTLLLGIQAGIISLTPTGCSIIAKLMELEAVTINRIHSGKVNQFDEFKAFQTNSSMCDLFNQLRNEITTFKQSKIPLIFLGDAAHDRLSSNKDSDREIREWLKASGAVYILGNHDTTAIWKDCHQAPKEKQEAELIQYGYYARDSADEKIWETHERYVFVRAHWDSNDRTLYTHHGVQLTERRTVNTGFGEINVPAPNATELVPQINRLAVEWNSSALEHCTYFRPHTSKMEQLTTLSLYFGIRQIHGHDGNVDDNATANSIVIGLNSRNSSGFAAIAKVVGNWEKPLTVARP